MASERKVTSALLAPSKSSEKIYKLSQHSACTVAGLTSAESEAKDEEEVEVAAASPKKRPGELTKQDVLELLEEIVSMQGTMKTNMKALTKEMAENSLNFEQIYGRVKEAQPQDPCEKRGLKPEDLDRVLQSYSSDDEVMQAVSKIMGPPEPQNGVLTKRAKETTIETLVDIHVFMLQELKNFIKEFQGMPDNSKFDMKTVGIVTQAKLDAKVSSKFNITSEDMEGAILANKTKLVQDMKFLQTHMEMQQLMQQFLGASMM